MPQPRSFPVRCSRDRAVDLVGGWSAPAAPGADLGPIGGSCGPSEPVDGPADMAPRPSWQQGSIWAAQAPKIDRLGRYRRSRGAGTLRPFAVHETSGGPDRADDELARGFGQHVRALRRARGMTQDQLAQRCGLSADTIRRVERGSFSPSLATLRKLCSGLDLPLSTLFESFEIGEHDPGRELRDLLSSLGPRERTVAIRLVRALADPR